MRPGFASAGSPRSSPASAAISSALCSICPADALPQHLGDLGHQGRAESPPDDVHTERQRQSHRLLPPDAEVDHQLQAPLRVQHPTLVNQQRRVHLPRGHGVEDAPEGNDGDLDRHHARFDEPQHHPGGGGQAGDAHPFAGQVSDGQGLGRHHHRPEPPPHRCAVRQQLIVLGDGRIQPAEIATTSASPARAMRFSAAVSSRRWLKVRPGVARRPAAEGVKHERIVGVHRVGERDLLGSHGAVIPPPRTC